MALLEVRGLTKRFDGLVANSDIDLDVPEGSLFAVIGPNGAGKTTFFNMISGFLQPTSGSIAFAGTEITNQRQDKIAAMGLVRTFQLVQLFGGMSVAENVEVGCHLATKGGIGAALVRPPWFRHQETDVRVATERVQQLRVALVDLLDTQPTALLHEVDEAQVARREHDHVVVAGAVAARIALVSAGFSDGQADRGVVLISSL